MNLKRGLLQILLAASLLAAQHGALAHGLLHAQQNLSAESSREDGGQKSPGSLCDFHRLFAEVLGAVGSAVSAPTVCVSVENPDDIFVWAGRITQPASQRSRGPPVIL